MPAIVSRWPVAVTFIFEKSGALPPAPPPAIASPSRRAAPLAVRKFMVMYFFCSGMIEIMSPVVPSKIIAPLCPARDVGGECDVVALGQRHLLRRHRPEVLQAAELQAQQLRLGDLGEHLGEAQLLQLEPTDRLAEHHATLGVADRLVVAGH